MITPSLARDSHHRVADLPRVIAAVSCGLASCGVRRPKCLVVVRSHASRGGALVRLIGQ